MAVIEDLMALLGKLPDGTPDDVKVGVKELFQKLTVEAGKAKTDLESYKKGDSEYKKLTKKLKDAGIEEDRYDSIAEELGVKKTLQDELAITMAAHKEALKKTKELEGQLKATKMESVLGRKIEEAAKTYKTPDGANVKISDRFIDKKALYADIDLGSDLLIQDRLNTVLKSAYENQTAFMKELGLDGTPVHKVTVGDSTFGSGKALDTSAVKAVLDKQSGSLDAAARALTMYEQQSKAA